MFWKKRIYADAAAATPLSSAARRELWRASALYGNPGALHQEALAAKEELERARASVAQIIGAHVDEIVLTASGTEANNLALLGTLGARLRLGEKLSAITSTIEHQSVLAPLQSLKREGLEVVVVGVQPDGMLFPNAISHALRPDTAAGAHFLRKGSRLRRGRKLAAMRHREDADTPSTGRGGGTSG